MKSMNGRRALQVSGSSTFVPIRQIPPDWSFNLTHLTRHFEIE